ncbi:MAG TPA: hypothetical protein VK993_10905 [Chthoniobacterales bacterium]|nr:hypothetical protein [Chthoniobacterales bacterium]
MAELKDFAGSVAIVVSSCDAFFDVWRPFAFFFHKHWADCPFPIFLIVNELQIRSASIEALPVGEDRGWASNMKIALEKLEQPHVLYLQEDYFLNRPVRREQLAEDLAYASEHDADAFCFRARTKLERDFQPINDRFGVVPRESDGRTRCQTTLWKRDAFLSTLHDGETAWEMEARGSDRTRDMLALSYSTRENAAVSYLMSGIVRGLWTREALAMCKAEGFTIAPHFRGTYSENSPVRRLRRALTRRRLVGELAKVRNSAIDLDSTR